MNNINDIKTGCTGCQMCATVCPFGAITIKLDDDGFYKPYVNDELCTNCGLCKKICSKYDKDIQINTDNQGVYAFKMTNKNILKTVSSGGAAYLLAQYAKDNGYMIAGTVYDHDMNCAKMDIDDNPSSFSGSKYIQTLVGDIYCKLFENDDKYIVFGTPCQMYAINKYAEEKKIRDKLILVDFFCHGCPSMLLWKNYIDLCKNNLKTQNIEKIEFRSKANAWHEFCVSVNGKPQKNSAYFYDLFFSDKILNEACYSCRQRRTFSYTDIRIGDFWGDCYDADKEGVSVVIAVSEQGKKLVDSLPQDNFIAKHKLEEVTKFQSVNEVDFSFDKLREKIFESLRKNQNIRETVKIYYNGLSTSAKIKRVIKKIVLKMPFSVRAFLRKRKHNL